MTLNRNRQGQGHRERSQLRRSHQGLIPCQVSSLYSLMWLRTNLNAKVNQNYEVTLNKKSQGQGHRERFQLKRSHPGLFHGSHRSWHTFFKDFWGIFSRSFQGLFFALSNIHSQKNDQQWTFQIRHTETIWSWVHQKNGGGGIFVCVFNYFRWFFVLWL